MNPENHPDNQHGFGAISNTYPNTGLEPDKKNHYLISQVFRPTPIFTITEPIKGNNTI
jgi:hypothetical protein